MADRSVEDIEKHIGKLKEKRKTSGKHENGDDANSATYDSDIYDKTNRYDGYVTSIPVNDEEDEETEPTNSNSNSAYSIQAMARNEIAKDGEDLDPMKEHRRKTIADRESEYQARKRNAIISPLRFDPFADGGKTPDVSTLAEARTYSTIMKEQNLRKEEFEIRKTLAEKAKANELKVVDESVQIGSRKRRQVEETNNQSIQSTESFKEELSHSSLPSDSFATPHVRTVWEATPCIVAQGSSTPSSTSSVDSGVISSEAVLKPKRSRWDATPKDISSQPSVPLGSWMETPKMDRDSGLDDSIRSKSDELSTPSIGKRSRWDKTPSLSDGSSLSTPKMSSSGYSSRSSSVMATTPVISLPDGVHTPGMTPAGTVARGFQTPTPSQIASMTPEQIQHMRWEQELDERNRPMTDEELDALFPFEGYKILQPPAGYQPMRPTVARLHATPTPSMAGATAAGAGGFQMFASEESVAKVIDNVPSDPNLPSLKPDDFQYFDKLLVDVDEDSLSKADAIERTIMKLLLKIKNGTPPMRKSGLRQITERAREFGAGPLFNQILPLLMSPTLEDQERHLLVKVIDRILYKLDDLVRPYVHKILVVIEPLLIDEDYYARVEGREIISNLAKAAGLATMISTMRPDIDNVDEYVRNTTARAFAVVASALGIPSMLPFLKAVCKSKKSWQARHTGIKIIQQIAILVGCAVLPHLKSLVEIIEHGLIDEQQKVRTITALAIAALAEASHPYGIESFDTVLKPLWKGIRQHRGKGLAAFLKAIGYLIPLMDAEYAFHYTKEVVIILIREFPSPDEEMKKIVLKVVKQCCSTDGVEASYIKSDILPEFFRNFWNHRMALDRRNYKQLVETTVEISTKVGAVYMINRVVDDLKDDNETYRKMVLETIDEILKKQGAGEVDSRLEEKLIDGVLYAFQEQSAEDVVVLNGFGTIVNTLGLRTKSYLPQICGTILWRLNNKSAKVRQQAADLIARIAPVMKVCNEEKLMGHLGVILFEYLGEEYPDVLGSILSGLKSIVNVIGMNKMTPPIKDLLPRLTPILKNRHEIVQENCIDLVGRIADRGAEHVNAREWMRICFELLELLKAHKKSIRRAAVNTFGYIAKAIGPQDVLSTLLSNLKVQERQNRVCTTVAIAIVAETCSPFTVLPALMNEYRVPELNVQNGVLKSLAFLFEYIGEMGKDYIYAVTPLLEDALMDRDLVHRQIASSAIKPMAVGVFGFGSEDALVHLMNFVWPNVFETSPHLINAVFDAIEGFRVGIGPCRVLQYVLQGLFHPARKVRDVYWRIYNGLYISSQDALVAFYPDCPNEAHNYYRRSDLLCTL